jgi:hypothetical protein
MPALAKEKGRSYKALFLLEEFFPYNSDKKFAYNDYLLFI